MGRRTSSWSRWRTEWRCEWLFWSRADERGDGHPGRQGHRPAEPCGRGSGRARGRREGGCGVGPAGPARPCRAGAEEIQAQGLGVTPVFIDLHVPLRERGEEGKETILSGTRAAVAGGFTAVAAMPNTRPVNDSALVTRLIRQRAQEAGLARVYP